MLKALSQLFNKKKTDLSDEKESEYQPKLPSNPNFLTDPFKIKHLLKDLESSKPLCTITFDSTNEEFSSSILDIDSNANLIVIDELLPEHGNDLIQNKSHIKVSAFFNGIHLAFKLDTLQPASANGIRFYKAQFPKRIYYPQRRKAPRINITHPPVEFAGIAARTQTSIGGRLFDISRTGIGIHITDNRARIQRGDIIKRCQIYLEDYRLDFDLTVRFIKKSGNAEVPRISIGGYFQNLSAQSKNKLSHYVAMLEREEIRKRKME